METGVPAPSQGPGNSSNDGKASPTGFSTYFLADRWGRKSQGFHVRRNRGGGIPYYAKRALRGIKSLKILSEPQTIASLNRRPSEAELSASFIENIS